MNVNDLSKKEKEIIKNSFLFENVLDEVLNEILSCDMCEIHSFKKNDEVYTNSKFHKSLGLVLSGCILAQKQSGVHTLSLNRIITGSYFGAAAIFTNEADYVTLIKASKDTRVVFFREELLISLFEKCPCAAENYIRFLTGRIRFLNRKIDHLGAGSTEKMLSIYLLQNAEYADSACVVKLTSSYSALAEMLGIGRASLYRALEAFEAEGLIKREGKSIILCNIAKLENL